MATAENGKATKLSTRRKRELGRRVSAVQRAREELHASIRSAHADDGATIRAIAQAVGLSPARVHALVKTDD